MMNVVERKQTTAQADARRWLDSFSAALNAQDTAAAANLFLADGLWRDNIPQARTPPRRIMRAGAEVIETLFDFETTSGPSAGVVRLVPDPQTPYRLRAWTLVTTLEELRGHEEAFKKRAAQVHDSTRDFGAENSTDRLAHPP